MNRATRAAEIGSQANPFHLKASFFHTTPVLERKRRTHWDFKYNPHCKRHRKLSSKQELLRNVSVFAEHLFQSWKHDHEDYDAFSSRGSSFFRQNLGDKRAKESWSGNRRPKGWSKSGFQFTYDDDNDNNIDVENIFHSSFGGHGYCRWSFIKEEPQWRSSSGYSNRYRTYWNWRYRDEEEGYDSSTKSDLSLDRQTLGLRASGPLSMEEIKNAYRECALKWHPDRHQGPSKAIAEEKFKACSAAYESLSDKLALN